MIYSTSWRDSPYFTFIQPKTATGSNRQYLPTRTTGKSLSLILVLLYSRFYFTADRCVLLILQFRQKPSNISHLRNPSGRLPLRFRPIMMTTMAALLGALPLMLGHGTGSELRQPLGYTMVGGLLVSQTLTLFTTPVIYLYLDRLNVRLGRYVRRIHSHVGTKQGTDTGVLPKTNNFTTKM